MNKNPQEFLTIDQQIELLKERKLIINDEKLAKYTLMTYDYYEVINGYKKNYVIKLDNHNEEFKPGVSFEQIFSLFKFDKTLRQMIMIALVDLEEHMRSLISYVIAKNYSSKHIRYLDSKNYINTKSKNPHWSKNEILKQLQYVIDNPKPPVNYHLKEYSNVPPWILLKQVYMSTLFNFVRILKPDVKTELIMLAYGVSKSIAERQEIKSLFMESLIFFLDYRNMAAHGKCMYSFIPKNTVSVGKKAIKELKKENYDISGLQNTYGIAKLINLLSLFNYRCPFNNVISVLNSSFSQHVMMYPNDIQHLTEAIGFNDDIELTNHNIKYKVSQIIDANGNIDYEKYHELFPSSPIFSDSNAAATLEYCNNQFIVKHNYRKSRKYNAKHYRKKRLHNKI